MGRRLKYEKPVLIDMASDATLAYSGVCDLGDCVYECSVGSCISTGYCNQGSYTGYCMDGIGACNTTSECYICCAGGSSVGFYGSGKGTTYDCWCQSGSNAAYTCWTGGRVSCVCVDGSYALNECNGGCA